MSLLFSGNMDSIVCSLVFFAFACHLVSGAGPKCYECEKVPDAQDCNNIVTCADNQKCFSQRFIGGDLREFFKLGCTDNDICVTDAFSFFNGFGLGKKRGISTAHAQTSSLSRRESKDDMVLCLQCCQGDYCNNNLCGATLQHTVPRCFSCPDVLDPRSCDTVVECGQSDSCYVIKTTHEPNHVLRYKLGCMQESQCKSATAVGNKLGCFACCKDKPYCNLNACFDGTASNSQNVTTLPTLTETTTPPLTTPTTPTTPPLTTPDPTPSVSLSSGPNIAAMLTRPVDVKCSSDPGVGIKWTFNDNSQLPQGVTTQGNGLHISNLNETNAGIYKCIAISTSGKIAMAPVKVSIKLTPAIVVQVIKSPVDHLLTENEQLTLECQVIGYPTPNVTWTYTGLGGETNVPTSVKFSQMDHVITIDHYNSFHNDGKWTCIAKNGIGQSQGSTRIP